MRTVATQYDAPIADMPQYFMNGDTRKLFFDDVHPKVVGYRMIAQELDKVMFGQD